MLSEQFPFDLSTLMKPEFVALVLGMSYRKAEKFIKRCEDAVRIDDQWFLPLWRVEEEMEEPFYWDLCPCEDCCKDYKLFIEGPARIVSTKEMR